MVSKGYEKYFAECYLDWLAKEIKDGVNDPEIVDIRINNLGTIFYPVRACANENRDNEFDYSKKYITKEDYEKQKVFYETKLEAIYSTIEKLNTDEKANRSKYKRRRVSLKNINNA